MTGGFESSNREKRSQIKMDPLTVTIYDRNVKHTLSNKSQLNDNSNSTPDGNSHAMFPTNIKYVFEDDDTSLTTIESENDEGIENVIIVKLDESGSLCGVELISDRFELLSYNGVNSRNDGEAVDDVELEVVSEFTDLSNLVHDLPLDELIKLYVQQNEQIQTISNSI